jgi:hypothetical protein
MVASDDQHAQLPRYREADMVAAITRLEQQVSSNHNDIRGHRQTFQHINETVGRLQHDMEVVDENAVTVVNVLEAGAEAVEAVWALRTTLRQRQKRQRKSTYTNRSYLNGESIS